MNTAKLIKETDKAIFVEFGAWVYERSVVVKTWMPKSQITITEINNGKITFEVKVNWLLGSKIKDYANYLNSNGYNMPQELKTFMNIGRNEEIGYCFC